MSSDMGEQRKLLPDRAAAREDYDPGTLLVHVHISKTAGSTLNHILRSSFGARHCPVEPWGTRWGAESFTVEDLRKLRRLYPNLKSIAGHRVFGYEDLEDGGIPTAYFALVRDPIKACASRFQHKVQRSGKDFTEFESWISNDWARNRHVRALAGTDSATDAIRMINDRGIFVGLTERFDQSILMLQRLVAPDLDVSYQRVNVASETTISQQLLSSDHYRAMIEEAQSADVELYRHVKDELWPKYRQAYGENLEEDEQLFAADRGDFNKVNIARSRIKAYAIYKPALVLHRLLNR